MTIYIRALMFSCLAMILTPSYAADPQFHIQEIQIDGTRTVSEKIILAESLLEVGNAYSEIELKHAKNRLTRLPFILEVSFALDKGSVRDTYILKIQITEVKRFTYAWDGRLTRAEGHSQTLKDDNLILGYRQGIGAYGMFYVTANPSQKLLREIDAPTWAYSLGYAHYDLFGVGLSANYSLNFQPSYKDESDYGTFEGDARFSHRLDLNLPLVGDQWLRASFSQASYDYESDLRFFTDFERFEDVSSESFAALLSWEFNTTNDNFLPTEGKLFTIAMGYTDGASDRIFRYFDPASVDTIEGTQRSDGRSRSLRLTYQNYHTVAGRHTYTYKGEIFYDKSHLDGVVNQIDPPLQDITNNSSSGTQYHLVGGYSLDLWGRARTIAYGDLRFQVNAGISHFRSKNDAFPSSHTATGSFVDAGLVHRNSWGSVKLTSVYSWDH